MNTLENQSGKVIAKEETLLHLSAGKIHNVRQQFTNIPHPHLWSLEDPYLYNIKSKIYSKGKCIDQTSIPYGIRWIRWPVNHPANNNQFLLNGKPLYINGVAGYEHLLGQSHAFSKEQVSARVKQGEAAGFNAFRDAHQPHNLRFQKYWEQDGILWWPQFAAHIWFDNPEFKKNFKKGDVIHIKKRLSKHRDYTPPLFIAAQYASDIMPGYDLKPAQHYPIQEVIIRGKGIVQQHVNKKRTVTFTREKGDSLEWKIKTGLGAKYSIRFRYSNEDPVVKKLKFYLISRENVVLQKGTLEFTKTKTGKWNTLSLMIQTEINAGTYRILLVSESAKNLNISGLDIQ